MDHVPSCTHAERQAGRFFRVDFCPNCAHYIGSRQAIREMTDALSWMDRRQRCLYEEAPNA